MLRAVTVVAVGLVLGLAAGACADRTIKDDSALREELRKLCASKCPMVVPCEQSYDDSPGFKSVEECLASCPAWDLYIDAKCGDLRLEQFRCLANLSCDEYEYRYFNIGDPSSACYEQTWELAACTA